MDCYIELSKEELSVIEGGCTWCKVGATLIAVGGVVASGCNPVAIAFAIPCIFFTWAC